MARPDRSELIRKFFPELGKTGTGGETQASIELNTRACEAVLADLIEVFDKFHDEYGAGALVVKLTGGAHLSFYITLAGFHEDLAQAETMGDVSQITFLEETIVAIKEIDTAEKVLFLLIDNSRASLLPVPRDYPARGIKALQEEATL